MSSFIALVFVIAMVYMTLSVDKVAITDNLMGQLTHAERKEYMDRVRERRNLYFTGYGLGVLVALAVMVLMPRYASVSFVAATAFLVNYFYYILSPKKPLLVTQLSSQKARDAWQRVYRHMQFGYHGGLALGVLAVAIFSSQYCPAF
jgi:predicted MFS family arabinose efflux permease